MTVTFRVAIFAIAAYFPVANAAGNYPVFGAGIEARYFKDDGFYSDRDATASFKLMAEYRSPLFNDDVVFNLKSRYRHAATYSSATSLNIQELNATMYWNSSTLSLGYDTVFWGFVESRNIVNVINQIDFVESFEGKERIGQLMGRVKTDLGFGVIEGYILPVFEPIEYRTETGRLTPPLKVEGNIYESSAGDGHVDYAARWSHYAGSADFAISYFKGTSRVPDFVLDTRDSSGSLSLLATYSQITQIGIEAQYAVGSSLLKIESISQDNSVKPFWSTVVGVEHGVSQVLGSPMDLTLYLEHIYDRRGKLAPPSVLVNEVMIASRLVLNDVKTTSLTAALFHNVESYDLLAKMQVSSRITDQLTVDAVAWIFDTGPSVSSDPEIRLGELSEQGGDQRQAFLNSESHLEIELTYYF